MPAESLADEGCVYLRNNRHRGWKMDGNRDHGCGCMFSTAKHEDLFPLYPILQRERRLRSYVSSLLDYQSVFCSADELIRRKG
jgi:hypothetical protein